MLLSFSLAAFFMYQGHSILYICVLPIISSLYYGMHLHYIKKSNQVYPYLPAKQENSILNHYLIDQVNQTLYFFAPNGSAQYQVKLLGRKWTLMNMSNQTIRTLEEEYKTGKLLFGYSDENSSGIIDRPEKSILRILMLNGCEMKAFKKTNGEFIYLRDNKVIARIKKGWLPLQLTTLFRLNTPVLSFQEKISIEDQEIILLASAVFYFK